MCLRGQYDASQAALSSECQGSPAVLFVGTACHSNRAKHLICLFYAASNFLFDRMKVIIAVNRFSRALQSYLY